jgi:hypothetical protein
LYQARGRVFIPVKRLRRKKRRSQLSEQFGPQINFARSRTNTVAVTGRLMITPMIVLAPSRMRLRRRV